MKVRTIYWRVPNHKHVDEAEGDPENGFYVEVDDVFEFAKKHGPLLIQPPGWGGPAVKDDWCIWTTDSTGKFNQRG